MSEFQLGHCTQHTHLAGCSPGECNGHIIGPEVGEMTVFDNNWPLLNVNTRHPDKSRKVQYVSIRATQQTTETSASST